MKLNQNQVAVKVEKLALNHWIRYSCYAVEMNQELLSILLSTDRPEADAHLMEIGIYQA